MGVNYHTPLTYIDFGKGRIPVHNVTVEQERDYSEVFQESTGKTHRIPHEMETTVHFDPKEFAEIMAAYMSPPPKPKELNNKYTVRMEAPLLRPGLEVETEVSEKYVTDVAKRMVDMAREINKEGC